MYGSAYPSSPRSGLRKACGAPSLFIFALSAAVAFSSLAVVEARAQDREVLGASLVVQQPGPASSKLPSLKARARGSVGISKGPGGDPALLSGKLEIFYLDGTTSGVLEMPSPWLTNQDQTARYKNRDLLLTSVTKANVKEKGSRAYIVKAKGTGGLDITNPPTDDGVFVQLTVVNIVDGSDHRMCSRFDPAEGSIIIHTEVGTGRKLILKRGVGVPCRDECADGFLNGSETGVDCGGNCAPCPSTVACRQASDCQQGVCANGTCSAATCSDGVKNGQETGVDCGNGCAPCAPGQGCLTSADCAQQVCVQQVCLAPNCTDNVQNEDETDVDCGGSKCAGCAAGLTCVAGSDCASGVCAGGTCLAPTCSDGVKNAAETDVDCGGGVCPRCADGDACLVNGDCTSLDCNGSVCLPPNCGDNIKNGTETAVDCGGSACGPCPNGKPCLANSDCTSGECGGSPTVCLAATCNDGVQNGFETDIDCGGASCPRCAPGKACLGNLDCSSVVCTANACQAPTCADGVKNGTETDIDCGGPSCPDCVTGKTCSVDSDCSAGDECLFGVCYAALCNDGFLNGSETDVDCGGGSCPRCDQFAQCGSNADCASTLCAPSGVCRCPDTTFTFTVHSNSGGAFDSAEWPGGQATKSAVPGCSATVGYPSGSIDSLTNSSAFSVLSTQGFTSCFGTGGEDGDGCNIPSSYCTNAVAVGYCDHVRPLCTVALNGSARADYIVKCQP